MPPASSIRHYIAAVLAAVACFAPLIAQAAPPPVDTQTTLTLDEAIRIALARQPQAAIAETQVTVAEQQLIQAKAKYLPTVTPQATLRDERVTPGGDGILVSPGGRTIVGQGGRTSITLNQTLIDAGQSDAAKTQAQRAVDSQVASLADTRQAIILNVSLAYYEVLRNRDLIKVAQSQVDRATTVLALTQGQIDAGTSPRKDAYQAKADLATAQLALRQSVDRTRTAMIQLRTAMGVPTTFPGDPAPVPTAAPPTGTATGETLATYLDRALASRPDLRARVADALAAASNTKLAKINSGIQVSGTYQYAYSPTSAFHDTGTDSLLQLSATYPLFDGGTARAGIRTAQAQQLSAEQQIVATKLAIASDVETSFVQREQAAEEARLAQSAVDAAQVNFDAVTEARREGIGNVVDIAQAQFTLTQAQSQYVSAVYDYYEATARLDRATGLNDAKR